MHLLDCLSNKFTTHYVLHVLWCTLVSTCSMHVMVFQLCAHNLMFPPQSILTVTFEVPGSLSEDVLNVFIQVRTPQGTHGSDHFWTRAVQTVSW